MEDKGTILDSSVKLSLKDIVDLNSDSKDEEDVQEIREEDDEIIDLDGLNEDQEDLIKNEEHVITPKIGLSEEGTTQGLGDLKSIPVISVENEPLDNYEASKSSVMNFNSIDLNVVPKEEAIKYLMKKKLKTKHSDREKSRKCTKYENVLSHFEQSKFKKTNYQRPADLKDKDPEITNDFETACTKFLANLLKGPNQNYNQLLKLMIYNLKIEEIQKV
jgi:hypothetical protein